MSNNFKLDAYIMRNEKWKVIMLSYPIRELNRVLNVLINFQMEIILILFFQLDRYGKELPKTSWEDIHNYCSTYDTRVHLSLSSNQILW